MEITLMEIKKERKEAADKIVAILSELQIKTGLPIEELSVNTEQSIFGLPSIVGLTLSLRVE